MYPLAVLSSSMHTISPLDQYNQLTLHLILSFELSLQLPPLFLKDQFGSQVKRALLTHNLHITRTNTHRVDCFSTCRVYAVT